MSVTIQAEVNPTLLVWAREESGYPAETVAKRLGVKLDRLEAWERGERKPTVRQTQELAKYYHRPFGVFFLPQRRRFRPWQRSTAGCREFVPASSRLSSAWRCESCCSAGNWRSS